MYGLSLLSFLLEDSALDRTKCIKMALVHDVAECIVGDITPHDNVPKDVKAKQEDVDFML